MGEQAHLITAIASMSGVIVFLALYIRHLHKQSTKDQNDNLLKMTDAMVANAKSQEHLANAIDDLKLVVVNRKK